ncbi:hypothetical protein WOLCODRAFT_50308, partial [Wolfiporia cocos MD-104 SS10]
RMDRFDCCGWLHIVLSCQPQEALIRLKHDEHIAYTDIELPDHWKEYIKDHARTQTPGEVKTHGKQVTDTGLPYRSKAVYYYWHVISKTEWRRADDPLESARRFIEENGDEYQVKLMDVKAALATKVLAFQVVDFVKEWAEHTQELAMDSTWNTNGANFEVFATVAEAQGSGIPLAFLLILTSPEAASGAKQDVLENFLGEVKKLGMDPEYTLTDKDWSEINAMHATWPNAKHQLCFWHALRALKQRLAKTKEHPAHYDVESACCEFSFIKNNFLPEMQRHRVFRSSKCRCTARIRYEEKRRLPVLSSLPIMHLFAKHASQHSLLPEQHGQPRTASEIRRDAVTEMYFHCERNHLPEVWAYLWTSWYSPSRWTLWARSANSRSIPCKWTTMMVEALWRNIKRLVLHMYNRPPVDLATYAIITKAIP